jgi:hypothetical protein
LVETDKWIIFSAENQGHGVFLLEIEDKERFLSSEQGAQSASSETWSQSIFAQNQGMNNFYSWKPKTWSLLAQNQSERV